MDWKKIFTGLALRASSRSARRLLPQNVRAIECALSPIRLNTYKGVSGACEHGLDMYLWNAHISGFFLFPLHICEVTLRNAVTDALVSIYGDNWAWDGNFRRSLPNPVQGYSPRADLILASEKAHSPTRIIPELKFAFWQSMFTRRHDKRIWESQLARVMPNMKSEFSVPDARRGLYNLINEVRCFRNRIAHHEPVINRDLLKEYNNILTLIGYISTEMAEWVEANQMGVTCITNRPT